MSKNHGQQVLIDAIANAIDRVIAEWDLSPVEIIGVLANMQILLAMRVDDGSIETQGDDDAPEEGT